MAPRTGPVNLGSPVDRDLKLRLRRFAARLPHADNDS